MQATLILQSSRALCSTSIVWQVSPPRPVLTRSSRLSCATNRASSSTTPSGSGLAASARATRGSLSRRGDASEGFRRIFNPDAHPPLVWELHPLVWELLPYATGPGYGDQSYFVEDAWWMDQQLRKLDDDVKQATKRGHADGAKDALQIFIETWEAVRANIVSVSGPLLSSEPSSR